VLGGPAGGVPAGPPARSLVAMDWPLMSPSAGSAGRGGGAGPYGPALASVGMMLVAEKYGRQGLGRRLMIHLLDQAGDAAVFLTATRTGRPLYAKLGFRITGRSATFLGRFRPDDNWSAGSDPTRPARDDDLPALVRIDRPAFGADREYLLRRLFTFTDQLRILERDGQPVGYAGTWPDDGTDVIGPLAASDTEAAQTLITSVAQRASDPVRLDFDPARSVLTAWARSHGLAIINKTAFMVHGTPWAPGRPARSPVLPHHRRPRLTERPIRGRCCPLAKAARICATTSSGAVRICLGVKCSSRTPWATSRSCRRIVRAQSSAE